ncbi:hypothetical protein P691DRAFT_706431 [Macrolepiota fuliginosa MF-IS2]|uniref:RBR-type E3 ubiquitin transferase n=1 Tax=Macrolepiota fuliginosa MF-IS2 TaxID=1400762 RepID=A0A9P6C1D7_9AGAR|nr:hypothetical protein P691DRAFT_706431 [Macrolepiota fuliginosa MF-IS2]
MRPPPRNEEEGIADAQRALNDLRLLLRKRAAGTADDRRYALQFQLENLEDMLRVVTDGRYARNLSNQGTIPWGSGDSTLDTLGLIISTARAATGSIAATTSSTTSAWIGRTTDPLNVTKKPAARPLTPRPPPRCPNIPFVQTLPLRRNNATRHVNARNLDPSSSKNASRTNGTAGSPQTLMIPDYRGKSKLRVVNTDPPSTIGALRGDTPTNERVHQPLEMLKTGQRPINPGTQSKRPSVGESRDDDTSPEARINLFRSPLESGLGESSSRSPSSNNGLSHLPRRRASTPYPSTSDSGSESDTRVKPRASTSRVTETVDEAAIRVHTKNENPPKYTSRPPSVVDDSNSVTSDSWVTEPWSNRASPNYSVDTLRTLSTSIAGLELESLEEPGNATRAISDNLQISDTRALGIDPLRFSRALPPVPGPSRLSWFSPSQHDPRGIRNSRSRRGINGATLFRNSFISLPRQLSQRTKETATATLDQIAEDSKWENTCAACFDTLNRLTIQFEAPCGHIYCQGCGVNLVNSYTSQESQHPIRCCNIPIPNDVLRPILSASQYSDFLQKEKEYNTPVERRVYCPRIECKQFIKIGKIASYLYLTGRMKCPACSSWICIKCKEFMHPGSRCGDDNVNTVRFEALVKEKGWQRCKKCRRVVERTQGCLHMTCLCGYEFCYRCGAGSGSKCGHGVFGN